MGLWPEACCLMSSVCTSADSISCQIYRWHCRPWNNMHLIGFHKPKTISHTLPRPQFCQNLSKSNLIPTWQCHFTFYQHRGCTWSSGRCLTKNINRASASANLIVLYFRPCSAFQRKWHWLTKEGRKRVVVSQVESFEQAKQSRATACLILHLQVK